MFKTLRYSEKKPEWNYGGFLPHISNFNDVFNNSANFHFNYFPQNQTLEIMMNKSQAQNIYLIYSNNDIDYGEKIYVKDSIQTFNSKEFKVRFILDLKYSYYHLLSKQTNLANMKIWTLRHNDLNDLNYTFKDDFLDFDQNNNFVVKNYFYDRDDDQSKRDIKRYRFNVYDLEYGRSDYGLEYTDWSIPVGGEPDVINPVLYFVFSKQWGNEKDVKYSIVPLLAHGRVSSTPADRKTQIKFIKFNNSTNNAQWTRENINNGWDNIISLYKASFANQLVGVFWGPSLLHLDPTLMHVKNGNTQEGNQPFLVIELKEQGIPFKAFIPFDSRKSNEDLYLYNNRDIYYMGVNIRNYGLVKNKDNWCGVELNGMLSFGGTMTLNLKCGRRSPYEMVIPLPSFINFLTDEYARFIQANYNQINTSLQIAKQNADLNYLSGALSAAVPLAAGIGSANPMMIASGAVALGDAMIRPILGYSHERKKINAMLADRKASVNNQLLSSNEQTNSLLLYHLRSLSVSNNIEDVVIVNEIEPDVRLKFKRLTQRYGFYSPKYKTFNEINNEINVGESRGYLFEDLSLSTQLAVEISNINSFGFIVNNDFIEKLTDALINLRIRRT